MWYALVIKTRWILSVPSNSFGPMFNSEKQPPTKKLKGGIQTATRPEWNQETMVRLCLCVRMRGREGVKPNALRSYHWRIEISTGGLWFHLLQDHPLQWYSVQMSASLVSSLVLVLAELWSGFRNFHKYHPAIQKLKQHIHSVQMHMVHACSVSLNRITHHLNSLHILSGWDIQGTWHRSQHIFLKTSSKLHVL